MMYSFSIRYKSTFCYFIDTGNGLLAFDAGWPDTFSEYRDCLKQAGRKVDEIKWLMVSHFHIDHAGLAGFLAGRGIEFTVFKNQVYGISEMEELVTKKNMSYHRLDMGLVRIIALEESRNWLKSIGIEGEVLKCNGHGEQSVALLLDSGEAFIGDLPPEEMYGDFDDRISANWKELKARGAKYIKAAHVGEFEI